MATQYDKISSDYHKHMSNHDRTSKEDMIDELGFRGKSVNVLEYGCGTGIDANNFLLKHANIVSYLGVDNSQSMLDEFTHHVKDTRATTVLADLDSYVPTENEYDLIFSMFSIHYTNNIGLLMKRVYAALKPGGCFVFRDAHPLVGFFLKKSKRYNVKENVAFPLAGGGSGIFVTHPTFTLDEYINSAIEAGFQIERVVEKMGSQSKALGIDGYEIPTTVMFYLRKNRNYSGVDI